MVNEIASRMVETRARELEEATVRAPKHAV
jgi:hypothetical protein